MFQQLKRNFNPTGVDFEALRSAGQFSHKVQRLRDLKSEAEPLPPPLQSEEQELLRLEALVPVLAPVLMPALPKEEAMEPVALVPDLAGDPAILARRMREEKAKIRIEKLKDLQHLLNRLNATLGAQPAPVPPVLGRLQKELLAVQKQLATPYVGSGALAENEGMGVVRPYLVKLTQKLDCLQQNKPEWLEKVRQAEAKTIEKLKAPNPLPVLERAALLALGQALEQAIGLCFAHLQSQTHAQAASTHATRAQAAPLPSVAPAESDDPELQSALSAHQLQTRLFQARSQLRNLRTEAEKAQVIAQIQAWEKALALQEVQERIQYLQRFNRSQELALQQVQRIAKQSQIGGIALQALHLGKNSLLQTGLRLLKEQQALQEAVGKWGEFYLPLQLLLQRCQRRWAELRGPDFFSRWQTGTIPEESAEITLEGLTDTEQEALQHCLKTEQNLFQHLAQSLAEIQQAQAALELQAKITRLDSLFENWQASLSSASAALAKAEDEDEICQAVGSLERATGQWLRFLPTL